MTNTVNLVGGPFDGGDYELLNSIRPNIIHVEVKDRRHVVAEYSFLTKDSYGFVRLLKRDTAHPGHPGGLFGNAPHFDVVEDS
jgi:hypothetical protein